ncbi:hypothetical protein [Sebaldella sp. S0638]|uniref:hypothetical protein n=1 Tax=Sebaldella sp. S0638 TaxID=2957809 RepID=UPI00209E4CA7|nr:hypothetical protein [Sebaldella sp. S0638]MCP1226114.1 hypothetical protein [Sebaldella sp. S0638]
MKSCNESEIIWQIKEHYRKYGKTTAKSFNENKETCSSATVKRYFGHWENAKKEAGINEEEKKDRVEKLIKEKIETGELRHISAIDGIEGLPSYKYVKTLWNREEIEEKFGIKIRKFSYSKEEIAEAYREIKEEYRAVTLLIMKKEKGIGASVVRRHFGTWNEFLRSMGDEPVHVITNVTHTNEELIELYRKLSIRIGKEQYGATLRDLIKYEFPYSKSVLASRFTGINNLRRLAGFEVKKEVIPKYNKQSLKLLLYKNYKKYGRRLSQTEIAKDENLPNPSSIFYCFQTTKITEVWNEVLNVK